MAYRRIFFGRGTLLTAVGLIVGYGGVHSMVATASAEGKEPPAAPETPAAATTTPVVEAEPKKVSKRQVVIVGGGTAGITVAAQLKLKEKELDIAIVEPSEVHYYQPLWTMVGGGLGLTAADSAKSTAAVIPPGCSWLRDKVTRFEPESNSVELSSGQQLNYDYLVVATGIQVRFDAIKGLRDSLGKNNVCTIYDAGQCDYVWAAIQQTKSGNAIFTVPPGPVKCGGAPQKIMYLAEQTWREKGLRHTIPVLFNSSLTQMFPVKLFSDRLDQHRQSLGIEAHWNHQLVEVRGEQQQAVFLVPKEGGEPGEKEEKVVPFGFLHVVPPMGTAPELAASPLVDGAGYVTVNKFTLQHTKYPNIYSLGDCSNLPTSKTTAAIASQAPVCVANLLSTMHNRPLVATYDGYTCCPLITSKSRVMLAEFAYDGAVTPTFPGFLVSPTDMRGSYFFLKRHVFPFAYWNLMLHGRWFGRNHLINPHSTGFF